MTATAEKQLSAFMAAYTPTIASTARAARAKLRALLPGATELVYDNCNAQAAPLLIITSVSPTQRPRRPS